MNGLSYLSDGLLGTLGGGFSEKEIEAIIPTFLVAIHQQAVDAWIVLNEEAVGGEVITLSSDDPTIAGVSASVTFLYGETIHRFSVTGVNLGTTIIRAVYNTVEVTANVAVRAAADTAIVPHGDADTYNLVVDGSATATSLVPGGEASVSDLTPSGSATTDNLVPGSGSAANLRPKPSS